MNLYEILILLQSHGSPLAFMGRRTPRDPAARLTRRPQARASAGAHGSAPRRPACRTAPAPHATRRGAALTGSHCITVAGMDFLFGKQKTPAERVKEYNRQIKKSIRELDREKAQLERQEKKLMSDIKKAAKDGHMDSAKIMAKDLVRTRGYIKKMMKMKSHMEAVSLRLMTMSSSASMAQAMKGVTKAMGAMNRKASSPTKRTGRAPPLRGQGARVAAARCRALPVHRADVAAVSWGWEAAKPRQRRPSYVPHSRAHGLTRADDPARARTRR